MEEMKANYIIKKMTKIQWKLTIIQREEKSFLIARVRKYRTIMTKYALWSKKMGENPFITQQSVALILKSTQKIRIKLPTNSMGKPVLTTYIFLKLNAPSLAILPLYLKLEGEKRGGESSFGCFFNNLFLLSFIFINSVCVC